MSTRPGVVTRDGSDRGPGWMCRQPADDCPAVAACALLAPCFGPQNLETEFAFSGVGINPIRHAGQPGAARRSADPQAVRHRVVRSGNTGAAFAALGFRTLGIHPDSAALRAGGFKNSGLSLGGSIPPTTRWTPVCAITYRGRRAVPHEVP